MYSSKGFNYNYMGFFGYEKREKLIWTSAGGYINTNTISKQITPKGNMKITSPSET